MIEGKLPIRYEITMYRGDGDEPEVKTITAEERRALDLGSFDYALDAASGTFGFRTESGEWVQRFIKKSGIGEKSIDIIRAVQINAGVALTSAEIAQLTGNEAYLMDNTLAVRVSVIRKVHFEDGSRFRLFVTGGQGGYSLMWPAKLSWIWIDRIYPAMPAATPED